MPYKQSESERCAPWGGAHDVPMKPLRPYWDGNLRFCTEHGEYKIHLIQNLTAYVGYTPCGKSEMYTESINVLGEVVPPRSPFLFLGEREATLAIKKHHRKTLRALRLAKDK